MKCTRCNDVENEHIEYSWTAEWNSLTHFSNKTKPFNGYDATNFLLSVCGEESWMNLTLPYAHVQLRLLNTILFLFW